MAQLYLNYMTSNDTQEWPQDELYMKIDGTEVWSEGAVSTGDTSGIYQISDITGDSDTIELYEHDSYPNGDEFLGSYTVGAWEAGLPEWTANFNLEGADYNLVYQVF